jgi:hypothetical protein
LFGVVDTHDGDIMEWVLGHHSPFDRRQPGP